MTHSSDALLPAELTFSGELTVRVKKTMKPSSPKSSRSSSKECFSLTQFTVLQFQRSWPTPGCKEKCLLKTKSGRSLSSETSRSRKLLKKKERKRRSRSNSSFQTEEPSTLNDLPVEMPTKKKRLRALKTKSHARTLSSTREYITKTPSSSLHTTQTALKKLSLTSYEQS